MNEKQKKLIDLLQEGISLRHQSIELMLELLALLESRQLTPEELKEVATTINQFYS